MAHACAVPTKFNGLRLGGGVCTAIVATSDTCYDNTQNG